MKDIKIMSQSISSKWGNGGSGKTNRIVTSVFRWIFLLAFSYILIYPLIFMISTALKSELDFLDPTVVWVAKNFEFKSFRLAWEALDYQKTFINTITLEIFSALLEVASCSLAAYALSRFKIKEKPVLLGLLMLTIFVPAQMVVIPTAINFKHLDFFGILGFIGNIVGTELRPNILNTPFSFYLPSLFGIGLKSGILIYIYMQFFKGLPRELEEAAWVDGSSPFKTFMKIIIPSSGVVILTVTIFSVIWHWNDYYLAVMYTSSNYPISVALSNIIVTLENMGYNAYSGMAQAAVCAGCLMTIAPVLIMYIILQRKFIESVDRVGIVG